MVVQLVLSGLTAVLPSKRGSFYLKGNRPEAESPLKVLASRVTRACSQLALPQTCLPPPPGPSGCSCAQVAPTWI